MNPNQEVPIEITSRHEQLSERMREYALEKVQRLSRFHNRISRIQIVADSTHEEPHLEMIVHVDSGATLVAKEHQDHFKRAMDLLVDKMERQLVKNNEKRKHHKGAGGKIAADDLPDDGPSGGDGGAGPEETYDDAVRRDLT